MRIELHAEEGPANRQYAQGLTAGLEELGVEVGAGPGIGRWRPGGGAVSIGIGRPNPRRRVHGWIWLEGEGSEEGGLSGPDSRPPVAIAALDVPAPSEVEVFPFPVLSSFYAPGDLGAVFRVTRRFHLEDRPRVVMFGSLTDGPGLSRALTAMADPSGPGGELVLLDGIRIRAELAPVVHRLGLVGRIVFLPALDPADTAGVLLGADLAICPEAAQTFPFWIPWCHAAGVPVVAVDTPVTRHAAGAAALLVDGAREGALVQAMRDVLGHEALHRELLRRGASQAERSRPKSVAAEVLRWVQSARFRSVRG